MAMASAALILMLSATSGWGLHVDVRIHYPEKASPMEYCGLRLRVSTSLSNPDEDASTSASRRGPNLFGARIQLPNSNLLKQAFVGVMADVNATLVPSPKCKALCPDISPQGKVVQLGPYKQTSVLVFENFVDLWPTFCRTNATTHIASFKSAATGRNVNVHFRIPSLVLENMLPRPSGMLPAIMFRLNSEWYWPSQREDYDVWHGLMVSGHMEPIVIGEVYVEGVTHDSWTNQPIYTTELPSATCKICDPEYKFICDSWSAGGHSYYSGTEHNFGSAKSFFAELYDSTIPSVLRHMPSPGGSENLRVGVWGYCIGGLGAWSAMTTHPERYNIAYLGSPALDFNCGAGIRNASALTAGKLTPKIYIDTGAAEGELMTGQTALLFQKLQNIGLVEGRDVFYERAPFGTHQGNSVLRRATTGLLTLFGTDLRPVLHTPELDSTDGAQALAGLQSQYHPGFCFFGGVAAVGFGVAFFVGRQSVGSLRPGDGDSSRAQFLLG